MSPVDPQKQAVRLAAFELAERPILRRLQPIDSTVESIWLRESRRETSKSAVTRSIALSGEDERANFGRRPFPRSGFAPLTESTSS